jgi:hypothetical protein
VPPALTRYLAVNPPVNWRAIFGGSSGTVVVKVSWGSSRMKNIHMGPESNGPTFIRKAGYKGNYGPNPSHATIFY